MKKAIKYRKSTGEPFGLIEASNFALLLVQYSELDATNTGVVEIADDHPFFSTRDFARWDVQDGQLMEKEE